MFTTHCPRCDRRVLLGHNRIERLRSGSGHTHVDLRCWCGDRLRWTGGAGVQR